MTLQVFPNLDTIGWDTTKKAEFKTAVFEAISGIEYRYASRQFPVYFFKLSVAQLIEEQQDSQLALLLGFMLSMRGQATAFLFTDPNDNTVTAQILGAGNSANKDFQIVRTYGVAAAILTEPVNNVNIITGVYLDDVATTDYTVSATGLITFTTAPTTGVVVTWTGSYYYRVRFMEDSYEFKQLMFGLHECKDIGFRGSVRNIV